MLTLPEDLVILAVGAKPRGGPANGKLSWRFGYGVRGAVLVALVLAGRVDVADGMIVVRNQAPLGDKDLDEALASLTAPGGVPAGDWTKGSPSSFAVPWFRRLEAAGLLRSETVWLLFIAKREGYRLMDRARYESLRAAVRDAAVQTGQADPAMTALAGPGVRRRHRPAGLPRPRERAPAEPARRARRPWPGAGCPRGARRYWQPILAGPRNWPPARRLSMLPTTPPMRQRTPPPTKPSRPPSTRACGPRSRPPLPSRTMAAEPSRTITTDPREATHPLPTTTKPARNIPASRCLGHRLAVRVLPLVALALPEHAPPGRAVARLVAKAGGCLVS